MTIKMETVVRKPLMIKIIKFRFRNFENKHLKEAGGDIGQNIVEITIKIRTIVRKPLMIKIIKLHLRNSDDLLGYLMLKFFLLEIIIPNFS